MIIFSYFSMRTYTYIATPHESHINWDGSSEGGHNVCVVSSESRLKS